MFAVVLLVACVSRQRQVVHLHLPRMPNSPNHQTAHPLTVPVMGGLFHKVHIDTMVMPRSSGYHYIIQAWCALTAYLEWHMLRFENASAIVSFIFKDIPCRWGAVSEIITDNGPAFIQALDVLASRYGIHHIRISPYNCYGMRSWTCLFYCTFITVN